MLFYALNYIGGRNMSIENVTEDRLFAVDLSSWGLSEGEEFGFWPMLFGGFFLYASYYGTDQSQVQRLLSASSLKTAKKSILFNGILRFPLTLSYCIMGLVVGTMVSLTPDFAAQISGDRPDLMIPVFIRDYLPHGIIGILIVAILSAAMSSLSSAINSLSAVTTEDFIASGREFTHEQYVRYSRWTALFWGLICIVLAFYTGNIADTVIEAINKIGSVFFGPILATFLIAVKFRRVGASAMNIGLIAGVGVNLTLWLGFEDSVFWFWWNAIGTITTMGVSIGISYLKTSAGADQISDYEEDKLLTRENLVLLLFFLFIVLFSIVFPGLF
jgi:Na+/proline symporter